MGLDALDRAFGPRLDDGLRWRTLDQAVQVRRGGAHQQRALAAREHRRHVGRLDARRCVADAVDAGVHDDQGATLDPQLDFLAADPLTEEAATRHHPMSPPRQPCDHPVRPVLHPHSGH
jgi:hypothetical protein